MGWAVPLSLTSNLRLRLGLILKLNEPLGMRVLKRRMAPLSLHRKLNEPPVGSVLTIQRERIPGPRTRAHEKYQSYVPKHRKHVCMTYRHPNGPYVCMDRGKNRYI